MLRSIFGKGGDKKMSERQQILEMLASGKISVAEAEKLLSAIGEQASTQTAAERSATPDDERYADRLHLVPKHKPRFLRVLVSEGGSQKVDVKVPLQLIRAGVKLGSVIPKDAQTKIDESLHEKGIQFSLSDMKPETIEELIDSLCEFSVNVDDDGESVRVFCE